MTSKQHSYQYTWLSQLNDETGLQLIELYNDALKSGTYLGYAEEINDNNAQTMIATINKSLADGDINLLAVIHQDQVVGTCTVGLNKMPNCAHIAELSKGIIHSRLQASGLLMSAFIEIAKHCQSQGIESLVLDVRENSRPHRLWSRLGFRQYGRLDDYARVDGQSNAGVYLQQSVTSLQRQLRRLSEGKGIPEKAKFLDKAEFKKQLRHELESRITMTHPIIQQVVSGDKANWTLLRFITLQGYQLTKYFLEYVETLYFHCPQGIHKRNLLMNMYEEETGFISKTKNHVVLMENFIRAIGVSDEERDRVVALPPTQELIDYRLDLVHNKFTFHLGCAAVMVASEGQNLETKAGEARHDLLPKLYGLKEQDLLFFSVHQAEDVGHVTQGIAVVADMCTDVQMQQEALEVVRHTCDLFYGMYDGIAQAYEEA